MIPVDQTIVSEKDGDCTRASLASILELPIDAVPNFMRFGQGWFRIFSHFLMSLDYEFLGTGWVKSKDRPKGHILSRSPNIKGYVIASVPSKTFPNSVGGHSVVMNLKGLVVHDPNPNKAWQNINVLKSKELQNWMMIGKVKKSKKEKHEITRKS
jgi:hypothetical protein